MSLPSYDLPIKEVLQLSSKTIVVLDKTAAALSRLWVLYQVATPARPASLPTAKPPCPRGVSPAPLRHSPQMAMTLYLAPTGKDDPDPSTKLVLLDTLLEPTDVARIFHGIDVAYARCSVPAEREKILKDIATHFGTEQDKNGLKNLTREVKLQLAESFIDTAGGKDRVAAPSGAASAGGQAPAAAGGEDDSGWDGTTPSLEGSQFKFHAFLSHDWGTDSPTFANHQAVKRINEGLEKRGLKPWFDANQMEGNIVQARGTGFGTRRAGPCAPACVGDW